LVSEDVNSFRVPPNAVALLTPPIVIVTNVAVGTVARTVSTTLSAGEPSEPWMVVAPPEPTWML
jgi:hypothetical protein